MRRHLREAARESGDTLPGNECLGVMIRRWEKDDGGVSERYRMHYCRAFKIPFEQFGTAPVTLAQAAGAGRPAQAGAPTGGPEAPDVHPSPPPAPPQVVTLQIPVGAAAGTAGDVDSPGQAGNGESLAHQVQLTAREGGEHAQRAERRDIGEASLEQLRSEVTRLSREYVTGEPLPLFFEMRRVREHMYTALDRKLWPRDEVELYYLLGSMTCLMADTAEVIGNPAAADELARAGLAYALAIGHRPLIARLRLSLAAAAWWAGQPRRCLDLARSGLENLSHGATGTQLHLMSARAAARLGDSDTAMACISDAAQARDLTAAGDLAEIGGQFALSQASFRYLAGTAAAEIPAAHSEAITQLSEAVDLYAQGPEPGEDHSEHCKNTARIDLAAAFLAAGDLDAAVAATAQVLTLPAGRRISHLPPRLARLRAELTRPRYRNSPDARELDELIERFCADTITTRLRQATTC